MKRNNYKSGISFALSLTLFTTLLPNHSYADINLKGHWAESAVVDFSNKGYLYKNFGVNVLNRPMTRAEFISIFNKIISADKKSSKIDSYKDVSKDAWYYDDVAKALEVGYISGTSDSTMSPNSPISREQAFVIVSRYLKLDEALVSKLPISDVNDISPYAKGHVFALVNKEYVKGNPDGRVLPKKFISNAEGIVFLSRLKDVLLSAGGSKASAGGGGGGASAPSATSSGGGGSAPNSGGGASSGGSAPISDGGGSSSGGSAGGGFNSGGSNSGSNAPNTGNTNPQVKPTLVLPSENERVETQNINSPTQVEIKEAISVLSRKNPNLNISSLEINENTFVAILADGQKSNSASLSDLFVEKTKTGNTSSSNNGSSTDDNSSSEDPNKNTDGSENTSGSTDQNNGDNSGEGSDSQGTGTSDGQSGSDNSTDNSSNDTGSNSGDSTSGNDDSTSDNDSGNSQSGGSTTDNAGSSNTGTDGGASATDTGSNSDNGSSTDDNSSSEDPNKNTDGSENTSGSTDQNNGDNSGEGSGSQGTGTSDGQSGSDNSTDNSSNDTGSNSGGSTSGNDDSTSDNDSVNNQSDGNTSDNAGSSNTGTDGGASGTDTGSNPDNGYSTDTSGNDQSGSGTSSGGTNQNPDTTTQDPEVKELTETKIELKNIENAYLYRANDNNELIKLLSIDEVDQNLDKYKVKAFVNELGKEIWLNVNSIILEDNRYKVNATFKELVSIEENGNTLEYFSIYVNKKTLERDVYTNFSTLINAIKANPAGTFIIGENLTATEVKISNDSRSYLDGYLFSGTLKSKDGNVFSILDLKKPLFDSIFNAKISNINLENVNIEASNVRELGSLANTTDNSTIRNITANGSLTGKDFVGGLIGSLDMNSSIDNSSFIGKIYSIRSAGGLVAINTRNSVIRNSYADAQISTLSISDDKVGGLVAEVNQNASVIDSYAKGSIENVGEKDAKVGGAIGAIYSIGNDTGVINNVTSFVDVKNGKEFIGNLKEISREEKQLSNNSVVIKNDSTNIQEHESLTKLSLEDAESKVKNLFSPVKSNNIEKNNSILDYSNVKDYRDTHKLAYKNLTKIMPFYDRYTIIKAGNTLDTEDSFNTKEIKAIQVFAQDNLVNNLFSEKDSINKILIFYTDGTKEEIALSSPKEFKNTGIIDYKLGDKNIVYHPNKLAKDYSSIARELAEKLSSAEYDYRIFNPDNLADWVERDRKIKLSRLYLDESFEKVKAELNKNLLALIDNTTIGDYSSGLLRDNFVRDLDENKNSILVGLTYIDRWYNFGNTKENILYSLDIYGKTSDSLELVKNLGNKSIDILASEKTQRAYSQSISKFTNQDNHIEFVKENYKLFKKDNQNIDDFIKDLSKAYIVRTDSKSDTSVNATILDRLSHPKFQNLLLPLLNVGKEHIYAIFTTNSNMFGIYDRYMSGITEENINYKKQLNEVREKVDYAAQAAQRYFDTLYRFLNERSKEKLKKSIIQVFDGYSNRDLSRDGRGPTPDWSNEYGEGAFDSVKDFIGPIRRWVEYNSSAAAYAPVSFDLEIVHFSKGNLLSKVGLSTLTHEHVHNLDDAVLFDGYRKRFGHGAESFARGLLQSPTPGLNTLGINLIFEVEEKEKYLLTHNSNPERFQNTEDLQKYMQGVFDVLYTLDVAEAEVILQRGHHFIKEKYKMITATDDYGSHKEDTIDRIYNVRNLKTLDDLVDNGIVGYHNPSKTYGRDDYIEIDMFASQYGILENPNGASGGFTFRRVAFELLAEKGYYGGMVPYLSSQYFFTSENPDTAVQGTDSYILNQIFDGKYPTFKDFRKDMLKRRKENASKLKEITILDANNRVVTIRNYNDIVNVIRTAINSNNYSALLNVKRAIYNKYLIDTNEFRDSIYKD